MEKKQERYLKMLTLIPWLNTAKTATFEELCRRFDYKPRDLLADLMSIYCVGIPPYGPGELIDFQFDPDEEVFEAFDKKAPPKPDWSVTLLLAQSLTQPPNLTPVEILNLFLLNSAIQELGLDIEPVLVSAIQKIKDALGSDFDSEIQLNLEPLKNQINQELEDAIQKKIQIQIDYHSLRENRRAVRTIEPWKIFFVDNAWYLIAYDHIDKDERHFRVARIIDITPTSNSFAHHIPDNLENTEPESYKADPDSQRIVLELDPSARWALDLFLYEKIEYLDGYKIMVTLPVNSIQFLERLLLQIGPNGRIVSGDYPKDLGKKAARKLLKKYST